MPIVMAILTGMASGAGNLLVQAGSRLVTFIPTKAQSNRDKIYAETHKLVSLAVDTKFNADEYTKHATVLRDTIRSAANSAG